MKNAKHMWSGDPVLFTERQIYNLLPKSCTLQSKQSSDHPIRCQ